MSLVEIQKEVEHLSDEELKALKAFLDDRLMVDCYSNVKPGQLLGSLSGTIEFGPGWEEPLPETDWEAVR